jgi:hypothetical protein
LSPTAFFSNASVSDKANGPETRTTAMAPTPAAVARATMVSTDCCDFMILKLGSHKNKESPAGSAGLSHEVQF